MWQIIKHCWPYNKKYIWGYAMYVIANIVNVLLLGIAVPFFVGKFIDTLNQDVFIPNVAYGHLLTIVYCTIGYIMARIVADLAISYAGPLIYRDIELDNFRALHDLDYEYFAGAKTGSIVAKFKQFSEAYYTLDLNFTRGIIPSCIQLIAVTVIVWFLSAPMALVFLVWGASYFLIIFFAIRWKMTFDIEKTKAKSAATGILADTITNFVSVKIFSRFSAEESDFTNASNEMVRTTRKSWYASIIVDAIQSIIIGFVTILILFLSIRYWQQGKISIGTIVILQTYAFVLGNYFSNLSERLKAIYRALADATEMLEILKIKPAVVDIANPQHPKILHGAIAINNMTFSHVKNQILFNNFTLEIPAGQKVGLVGHSGAGKSTLTSLLLRFMNVQHGTICIDDQDISQITQNDLRRYISYVPQTPMLFHRSIADNILYSKPTAKLSEVYAAAKQAYAHEFIEQLPNGYNTIVGERGIRLSGGERQRVAIARSLLKDAPIVVLDEATSALDSKSERYIQDALKVLMHKRTTITVAHRLSTIQQMDRIIVLDSGNIIEDGSHQELLDLHGVYADLWLHQSNGFLGI